VEIHHTFGEYEPDYFDFIIIDECHRVVQMMKVETLYCYFSPTLVPSGLTATLSVTPMSTHTKYFGGLYTVFAQGMMVF
jgi:type I site-specific restriction endonuclease